MTEQVSIFGLAPGKGDKVRVQLYSDEVQYVPHHFFSVGEVMEDSLDWCTVHFPSGEIEKIDTNKLVKA